MDWRNPQKQPGLEVIRSQARTIAGLARLLGVSDSEFRATLYGKCRPSALVREKLPLILGVPLEALYDADVLAEDKRTPGTPPVRRAPERVEEKRPPGAPPVRRDPLDVLLSPEGLRRLDAILFGRAQ